MKVTFTKSQLRLVEDDSLNAKKAPRTVMNSDGDNDTSSLSQDISKVNQTNSDQSDIVVPTAQYTNKQLRKGNNDITATIKNGPDAPQQIANIINNTNPNQMPGMITLKNGYEREGKLVEVATFNKKELDIFLESL